MQDSGQQQDTVYAQVNVSKPANTSRHTADGPEDLYAQVKKKISIFCMITFGYLLYVHLVGHAQENYLDFHWRQLNKGKLKTAAQVVLLFSHTHTHFTHIHISLLTTYSWCCVTTDLLTKPWIDTLPVWCKITCYFEIIYNSILWYSKNFYCTSYFLSLFLDLV